MPDDLAGATDEQRALWLMAQLVDYHRREDKPVWWAFFERRGMSAEELVEDAESIGDLRPVAGVEPEAEKRSLVYTLEFPVQEHRLHPGADAIDPATGRGAGTILSIDDVAGRLRLSRGKNRADDPLPRALIPGRPYDTKRQRAALRRLAAQVDSDGMTGAGPYRALRDVLQRALPRVAGLEPGAPLQGESVELDQAKEIALGLDRQLPLHPGAARLRQDLDRRAPDRPPDARRQAGRRHGEQPQGDPQPARGGRARRARRGLRRSAG